MNAQCLTMQGNLMLSVLLATEPDDEERVRTIAIDEWRTLAAPSATEKALVVHRFLNENRRLEGDPSELADRHAGSATWTRGEALFSLAPAWWAPPEFSDAAVRTVRAATTSERSSVFSGAD